jgi:hypothetical protein
MNVLLTIGASLLGAGALVWITSHVLGYAVTKAEQKGGKV